MRLYKYSFWTFSLWLKHPSIDIPVTVITIVWLLMILYFPYSFHICKSYFFCKGKLFSFSAYVFIYLCLCRLPDISFILWIIVQIIFYFICLNCFNFLSLGALLDWLLFLLEKPSSFFQARSWFLAPQDVPGSSCIFQSWNQLQKPGAMVSENVFGNQDLSRRCSIATSYLCS